jgi:hypothetical protein
LKGCGISALNLEMHHGLTQGTWSSLHDTGGQPSLTNQQADAERTQGSSPSWTARWGCLKRFWLPA